MVEKYCISPQASILEAMKKTDSAAIASVIVCEGGKVKGILTDGDIRRAIIGGAPLTAPIQGHYTASYVSVGPEARRADVLELMQARTIRQVPIVDADGQLLGIHTLHTVLGRDVKTNWAVVMAGGRGTRLGKLTGETPKPMLKVAGRPILERVVLHLVHFGLKELFIAVNHLSGTIEAFFGDGAKWGCSIRYLREKEPLGSAGALSLLPEAPGEDLLMINGDLLLEADLAQMLAFHKAHRFHATMGVHIYSHEIPFGCVETDHGRILALEEKPLLTRTINGGVYVLSPAAVQTVPPNTFTPATWIFEEALKHQRPCGAYSLDGDWLDVGMPDQLKQARGQF